MQSIKMQNISFGQKCNLFEENAWKNNPFNEKIQTESRKIYITREFYQQSNTIGIEVEN